MRSGRVDGLQLPHSANAALVGWRQRRAVGDHVRRRQWLQARRLERVVYVIARTNDGQHADHPARAGEAQWIFSNAGEEDAILPRFATKVWRCGDRTGIERRWGVAMSRILVLPSSGVNGIR